MDLKRKIINYHISITNKKVLTRIHINNQLHKE